MTFPPGWARFRTLGLPLGGTDFEREVLPLQPAQALQTLPEREMIGVRSPSLGGAIRPENPDPIHFDRRLGLGRNRAQKDAEGQCQDDPEPLLDHQRSLSGTFGRMVSALNCCPGNVELPI